MRPHRFTNWPTLPKQQITKTKKYKMKTKYITIIALSALMGTSHGVTSLVDFASATATPGTAQGGNFWTGVDTNSSTNLLSTTDGSDTGWDISVSFTGGQVGYGGNGINGNGDVAPFDQGFAIIDGIFSSSPAVTGFATLNLSSLSANATYDFVVYTDRATSWSSGDGVIDTTVGVGPTALATAKDTLTSFSITADGSGVATFTFAEGPTGAFSGDGVVLNAMSVTEAIPEPTAVLLCAFGAGFFLRRKR